MIGVPRSIRNIVEELHQFSPPFTGPAFSGVRILGMQPGPFTNKPLFGGQATNLDCLPTSGKTSSCRSRLIIMDTWLIHTHSKLRTHDNPHKLLDFILFCYAHFSTIPRWFWSEFLLLCRALLLAKRIIPRPQAGNSLLSLPREFLEFGFSVSVYVCIESSSRVLLGC